VGKIDSSCPDLKLVQEAQKSIEVELTWTVRFRFNRPDLDVLCRVVGDELRRLFNPKKPLFIETHGACSGNPGPGGWGCIVFQENRKLEAYGSDAATSNNTMELFAINEALKFFPDVRALVLIESDTSREDEFEERIHKELKRVEDEKWRARGKKW
jgi:hypothetical protein